MLGCEEKRQLSICAWSKVLHQAYYVAASRHINPYTLAGQAQRVRLYADVRAIKSIIRRGWSRKRSFYRLLKVGPLSVSANNKGLKARAESAPVPRLGCPQTPGFNSLRWTLQWLPKSRNPA